MRIGVIGTGQIAHENVSALIATGRTQIVALCNRTREKAERFANEYSLQVPVYTDYHEMLKETEMDAVLINTPHGQHAEQFIACCEQGLHIMVEKPLSTCSEDAQRMAEAAKKAGIRACVCHTQRYLAPMMTLRRLLQSEKGRKLGRLRHVSDTINLNYFHDQRPAWFFDAKQSGGGLLMTHGAHQVDRLHLVIGRSTDKVFAHIERSDAYPELDSGYQMMGYCGNVTYLAQCAGYHVPQVSAMDLVFENGAVHFSWKENGVDHIGVSVGNEKQDYTVEPCDFRMEDTYLRQFSAMLDALEGRASDAPTLDEASNVIRTLEAMLLSDREQRPVKVEGNR